MLRITKMTDYAIMLLARMASLPEGRILSSRDAAEFTTLSVPMASKILKHLTRASIVASTRGAGGGYRLARAGDQISLADVIRALEGPISMVECATQPGLCEQEANCPVRVNWSRVNREIENALERVPITEMVTPDPCLSTLQSLGTASERGGES
jgi:FeS assembly SUF system regulator